MYTFRINTDPKSHDEFVSSSPISNMMQSSSWAKVKKDWDNIICSVYDDNKIVASSLILIRNLPLNRSIMYCPRGPIMDYENRDLVEFFLNELKKLGKEKGAVFITFDPALVVRSYFAKEPSDVDDPKVLGIIDHLRSLGLIHRFRSKTFNTIQATNTLVLPAVSDVLSHVNKQIKKNYNFSERHNTEFKIGSVDDVPTLAACLERMGERNHIIPRGESYLRLIMDAFGEDAMLFLATVNPENYLGLVRDEISSTKEELNSDELTNKRKKALEESLSNYIKEEEKLISLAQEFRGEQCAAAHLVVKFGKVAYMLYASRDERFDFFRANDFSYCKKIEYLSNLGIEKIDMGGVKDVDTPVYKFKANFNSDFNEFIGEFDIVLSRPFYAALRLAQKANKLRLALRVKLKR